MLAPRFIPIVLKQVIRHRTRSILTVAGVGTAMFLFAVVQGMQRGVDEATTAQRNDTTLIVYRENRFCPATSRLPEHYLPRIEKIPGVVGVVPMKVVVNNCRASLDVITFRGVPPERFDEHARSFTYLSGSFEDWKRRSDAALIGETLAARRGLKVGDRFDGAGVTVYVAGVVRSDEPQDHNVAYTHVEFLQRAVGKNHIGVVTQFNVKVDDPANMTAVAAAIDAEFAADQEPTHTRPERAFVAQAAGDIVEIVRFTRILGWGCLAAVLALVGNAIVLSVQDRIREHAVLQTLGFDGGLIARLIVTEGFLLGLVGGSIGTAAAVAFLRWGQFTLSVEGTSLRAAAGVGVLLVGLGASAALGALAGLVPALQASRREIAACFRAV